MENIIELVNSNVDSIFSKELVNQSIAYSFCNIKLLWWSDRASINSTTDLTGGFPTLEKINTLEWSDLATFLEVHTFPKIFGVRYSEILPKHCHSFSGVLTSFERPLCCVHVRDFKSSLLMSPAINLASGEVSKMLSQFHNNQRSLDGKPRERSKSWLVVDTFVHKYSYSLPLTSIFFTFQSSLHKIATPSPLRLARSAFEAFFFIII